MYFCVAVVIYRCRDMADNCGMCLALAEKYGCGWCQVSDRCEVKEQCDQGAGVWLNRNQTCPNPEVTAFEPQLGPWEGGTNITIKVIISLCDLDFGSTASMHVSDLVSFCVLKLII